MRIGILGAGNMANNLASQWTAAGHEVRLSGRAPAGAFAEAAAFGEVVLVAVPHAAALDVLAAAGPLAGKIVIDCTNAVTPGEWTLATGSGPSAYQRIAAAVPDAQVVKGFNLCHESVWRLRPPAFDGRPLAVPLCGDQDAVAVVSKLVTDIGCAPIAAGGPDRAPLLDATAALLIGVWLGGHDAQAMLPPLSS